MNNIVPNEEIERMINRAKCDLLNGLSTKIYLKMLTDGAHSRSASFAKALIDEEYSKLIPTKYQTIDWSAHNSGYFN